MKNIQRKGCKNGSKKLLKINGKTNDNKLVLSGESIFRFMDTRGMPLENILMVLDKNEYSIDWVGFIQISQKSGWKLKGTLTKIQTGLSEMWGKEYSDSVIKRLEEYLDKQSP